MEPMTYGDHKPFFSHNWHYTQHVIIVFVEGSGRYDSESPRWTLRNEVIDSESPRWTLRNEVVDSESPHWRRLSFRLLQVAKSSRNQVIESESPSWRPGELSDFRLLRVAKSSRNEVIESESPSWRPGELSAFRLLRVAKSWRKEADFNLWLVSVVIKSSWVLI